MKNTNIKKTFKQSSILQLLALLVCLAVFAPAGFAQQTAAGTEIKNQASATYSDGTDTYSTVSNTVTVTVAKVSGLTITPDAGSQSSVIPGQTNVLYYFTVTNTGNFADQVRFLANGASVQSSGSGTISAAVIDVNNSNTIDGGDTNILTNSADVLSASINQNASITVIVSVAVSNTAAVGSFIGITLGDTTSGAPTFDNQPADSSANEVRTVNATSVNGLREAKGSASARVDSDAALQLTLTAPAGPASAATATTPGSTLDYSWGLCNTGQRPATSVTLTNAPAGSNSGVFIIAPIPVGTTLAAGQTFPAGTLYSTDALTVSPLAANYTTAAPANLANVRRMAFRVGASLADGSCSGVFLMQATIVTLDATRDIYEIGDTFANPTVVGGGLLTDQSGDAISNKGDGNANFDEPIQGGTVSATQGFQQVTVLARAGSVLIGPFQKPAATGPSSNNDDYTNLSLSTQIAGLGFGSNTTAAGVIVYKNTIRNTGNANDTFVVTVPSAPAGFTVEISTDGGITYTTMTGGNSVSVPVNYNSDRDIFVRVTAPAGTPVLAENGFAAVIRSTSTLTPANFNETIDRLYTGFLRMEKSFVVINGTGIGGATDAVPGADIEYSILYRNLASTGGTDSSTLTVSNLAITEDGNVLPNNWGTTTTHVASPAPSDTRGGTIVLSNGDTKLVDTVPTLAPQQSGTFKFRRRIR